MKKEYMKPATLVVELQHKMHLLQSSVVVTGTHTTGLDPEDEITIEDTPSGDNFWGR